MGAAIEEQSERRKEPRKKLMAFTPVYDRSKGILLGYIQDLTLQGVLVIGEKKLEENTQVSLSFELPGGLPGADHLRDDVRLQELLKKHAAENL